MSREVRQYWVVGTVVGRSVGLEISYLHTPGQGAFLPPISFRPQWPHDTLQL